MSILCDMTTASNLLARMNEVVAADGPARLSSRPPFPPKRRANNRSLKQRERESPHVDWEHSHQYFAAAVSDDLDELHARFIEKNNVTFFEWKRLWNDAKMSAAFHVEFWDSSPTNTHKTILQQTLDALVHCIEENDGAFESAADVTSLIGRIFALYSAFSVQLGSPKHKIDVDPQAWSALSTINFVMCGAAASLLPTATREVRAMMHRLVVKENAFLRCLQGFGPSVRVRFCATRVQTIEGAGSSQNLMHVKDRATQKNTLIDHGTIERLKSLDDRYQKLMAQAQSIPFSLSSCGVVTTERRGRPTLSESKLTSQKLDKGIQTLAHALTSYFVYKANRLNRKESFVACSAAARKYSERKVNPEWVNCERGNNDLGRINYTNQLTPTSQSAACIWPNPPRRHDRKSREAFVSQLESDLHEDILFNQAKSVTNLEIMNKQRFFKYGGISDADSDALADLEQELELSFDAVSSRNLGPQESTKPSARRNQSSAQTLPQMRSASTSLRRKSKHASAISEIRKVDSDVLANLEGEVKHSTKPVISETRAKVLEKVSIISRREKKQDPTHTGTVREKGGRTAATKCDCANEVKNYNFASKRARSDSIASFTSIADSWVKKSTTESDGLAAIQAELDAVSPLAGPIQSTDQGTQRKTADGNVHTPQLQAKFDRTCKKGVAKTTATDARNNSIAFQNKPRKSSWSSTLASEAGSNAFDEPYNATASMLGPVMPLLTTAITKATSRKQLAKPLPVQKSTRRNAKKQRLDVMKTIYKADVDQTINSIANDKQQVQKPSRMLSDSESDGLAELIAELETVATQTRSVAQEKRDSLLQKSTTTSSKKPKVMSSQSVLLHSTARSRTLSPVASFGVRRSACSSSLVPDSESDGLSDLVTELESTCAVLHTPVAITKPQSQTRPMRKRNIRAQGKKARQGQTEGGSKSARARRTLQQAPTKLKCNKVDNVVHAPFSRRSIAPVKLRSKSVVSDSDSDGLTDLNAELQAGIT